MIDKGMVTAWILGSLLLFFLWVRLPEKAHKDYEETDHIQNPIARQGCLFLILVKFLVIGLVITAVFFVAVFVAKELGLMNNTPLLPGH